LYILDAGRDQVLERLASGSYRVVAGEGHRGFMGDGGPATRAELDLQPFSGIAVANDGSLYIADPGNDRVRAVLPDGVIRTVAGDGKSGTGMVLRTMPALKAALGEVAGITIGPGGDLYMAAGNVLKLTPAGNVDWVAGNTKSFACGSAFCNPASEADFTDTGELAFDGHDALFVSTWTYGLFEVTRRGHLEYLGQERGDDGSPEGLAEAPDGTVVEANHGGLFRLTTPSVGDVVKTTVMDEGIGDPSGPLDRALGGDGTFIGGYGVAAGPGGVTYAAYPVRR
jgi:hypothetical protein